MTHPAVTLYAEHVNPAFVRLLGTFGYGRVFVRAHGVEIWDSEGRRYFDFLAGFGAANLGHNAPRVISRLHEALAGDLCHVMHVGPQDLAGQLGEALAKRLPGLPMVLLSLSGGEAVEAAMKLARAATDREGIISCEGGFHGTGFGSLSLMGHRRWRKPFEPLLPQCYQVPYGDLEALEATLKRNRVAAFLTEVIQGEAGVVMASDNYLREAQNLCHRYGALLVVDEVQTGLGRTGKLFAFQHYSGIDPDVVVLGKALGGSLLPVSAIITRRELQEKAYGTTKTFDLHGSTYAGYALGCSTALEVLRTIDDDGLVERSAEKGTRLMEGLRRRIGDHPLVREIRGQGLFVAIDLGDTGAGWLQRLAPALVRVVSREVLGQWLALRLLEAGYVCQPASQAWNVLKLTPPLIIEDEVVDAFVDSIGQVFDQYREIGPLVTDVSRRIGSQYLTGWDFR